MDPKEGQHPASTALSPSAVSLASNSQEFIHALGPQDISLQDQFSPVKAQWQMHWYFLIPISYPLAILHLRESTYKALIVDIKLYADHFS